jgi:uncharacterized protein (DUF58 family)
VAELDEAAVERASEGLSLALPRTPHRGRVGEVRSASVGSSMEIHDFRAYQPGDDLRQVDWNAVARTGELILRVRQDEVSPRVEVVLDGSRSMALTPAKAARAREVALLLCRVAQRDGLEPTLVVTSRTPRRAHGAGVGAVLRSSEFDAQDDLASALRRGPPLRPCGLRLVVSDFLFETELDRFTERLSRQAAGLWLVQVLDAEDANPSGGMGAQLVDSETGEAFDRVLSQAVLDGYAQRLEQHQKLLGGCAQRVRGRLLTAVADKGVEALARGPLQALFQAEGARAGAA